MKVATLVEDGAWTETSALVSSQDSDWVRRHRAGDASAFDEIYRRFGRMVYGVALRLTGDAEDAADLAQEVFLRVHGALGRFRGGSSLRTWIYRITLNRCRSHLRRRRPLLLRWLGTDGSRDEGDGRDGGGDVVLEDPARGPEELAAAHDLWRQVDSALRRLPVVYREAVVLRDLDELSYEEVAAVLRVPIGTVRSRIARGRERLRQLMESTEPTEEIS